MIDDSVRVRVRFRFRVGSVLVGLISEQLIFCPISSSSKEKSFRKKIFGSSSVQYRSFSIRLNFISTILGVSSDRISVRVIRIRSLLPGLTTVGVLVSVA